MLEVASGFPLPCRKSEIRMERSRLLARMSALCSFVKRRGMGSGGRCRRDGNAYGQVPMIYLLPVCYVGVAITAGSRPCIMRVCACGCYDGPTADAPSLALTGSPGLPWSMVETGTSSPGLHCADAQICPCKARLVGAFRRPLNVNDHSPSPAGQCHPLC
jgi:hypothetical protein